MADDHMQRLIKRLQNVHDFKNQYPFALAPASLPGGHSVGVPPDPIPNSAVKPDCADGTIA